MVLFSQGGAGENDIRKMSAVSPSPGRFSPERKTPPGVSAPSTGLRPLSVSRVKCGGGPCRGRSAHPKALDICWIWAKVVVLVYLLEI